MVVVAQSYKIKNRKLVRIVEFKLALLRAFSFCVKFAMDNMFIVSAAFAKEATKSAIKIYYNKILRLSLGGRTPNTGLENVFLRVYIHNK